MTFYYFYPCPLLHVSCAPLNKHFLDTCCFNNLDYMVLLFVSKASCTGEFLPVIFYLYFYAIEFKFK